MAWKELKEPSREEIRDFNGEFRAKARFLIDESAGPGVAKTLRSAGYNVKYVSDLGLCGHSDEDVFAAGWREARIIVTHDSDFLDNRKFPFNRNPGVVVIRPGADGHDDGGLYTCLDCSSLIK